MPKPKKEDYLKKGEQVQAKWSGSNVFYEAKILDVLAKHCKVQYEDGSVFNVKLSDIKALTSDKESTTKTSRSKSRSRSKSPSRGTRARSRSPARQREKKPSAPKVEKRASLKREKKKPEENSNSVSKDEIDNMTLSKSESSTTMSSIIVKNNYSMKDLSINLAPTSVDTTHLRTSARLANLQAKLSEQSSELSKAIKQNTKLDSRRYSDDESDEMEVIVHHKPRKIWIVLYFTMTLLKIVLMPLSLLFLVFACTTKQCTVLKVPPFFSRWKDFENNIKLPLMAISIFHVILSLVSTLPLGRKISGFPFGSQQTVHEYRLNGFYSMLLSIIAFSVAAYFGFNMNWGFDKFKCIAFSSLLYCIIWALFLHAVFLIKGNGTKKSEVPLLGNFFDGVYINPRLFGKVDIKTVFIHGGLIGSVLMNFSILTKFFFKSTYLTLPHAVTSLMQMFFVSDLLWRQEKMLSTATYTEDGVGYGFVLFTGFLVPIALSLPNVFHFIYDEKSRMIPQWCLFAMTVLFFCGYYIYVTSSNLKHNFRRNPFSPSMSGVDSLPTSKKKRLISSGLWGIVRHPNYLGLLIMAIAWTLPCGFTHIVPFGPVILLSIGLVLRCLRVEMGCKEKYGPAWQNYTEKVRSRIIPYVF